MINPSEQSQLIIEALGEYAKTEDREFLFLFADENGYVGSYRTVSTSRLIYYLGKGEFRIFLHNLLVLCLAALGKQGNQDVN